MQGRARTRRHPPWWFFVRPAGRLGQRSSERVRSLRRRLQTMVIDQADHCMNRGRGRNRDRFLF
jgi:hypothetical protein